MNGYRAPVVTYTQAWPGERRDVTCSSRRGSRRRRRARSMSAASRAVSDSAGRSDSRRATRPRLPSGSTGRRLPADTTHRPVLAVVASLQSRLGPGQPRRAVGPPSLSRPLMESMPSCCRLLMQSPLDTVVSPHCRLITPETAASYVHCMNHNF